MPFLTLNGVTIPTRAGGEIKMTEYGERTAGFDGSAQIDVRARKRQWSFNTKPISMVRSRAIEGLVNGSGDYFPFDSYGNVSTGLYSSKGTAPLTNTGSVQYVTAAGADGNASYDENGVRGALVGTTALAFDGGATNSATTAIASCSSASGWTGTNATIALSTTHYWEGTNSLLTTPSSLTTVVQSPTVSATALTTWTVSCYIYSDTANVFLIGGNFGSGYNFVTTQNHPGGGVWKRFYANVTVPNGSSAVGLAIQLRSANGSTVNPFYIDGVQFESVPANSVPTTWKAGGSSTTLNVLQYPFRYSNPTGFTFSAWIAGSTYSSAGAAEAISIFDTSGNRVLFFELYSGQFNSTLTTQTNQVGIQGFSAMPFTQWTHVVVTYYAPVFTNTAGTTFPNYNMYINGVLAASSVVYGSANPTDYFQLGSVFGGYPFMGRMDDVQTLPYGVDTKWVEQTYAASLNAYQYQTGITGLTPFLIASGDGIDGAPVKVHGNVAAATYVGFQDVKYGWISQGRTLQIVLTEV